MPNQGRRFCESGKKGVPLVFFYFLPPFFFLRAIFLSALFPPFFFFWQPLFFRRFFFCAPLPQSATKKIAQNSSKRVKIHRIHISFRQTIFWVPKIIWDMPCSCSFFFFLEPFFFSSAIFPPALWAPFFFFLKFALFFF